MSEYCEICGDELSPEEEYDGVCEKCKKSQKSGESGEDEEYIDPGIT